MVVFANNSWVNREQACPLNQSKLSKRFFDQALSEWFEFWLVTMIVCSLQESLFGLQPTYWSLLASLCWGWWWQRLDVLRQDFGTGCKICLGARVCLRHANKWIQSSCQAEMLVTHLIYHIKSSMTMYVAGIWVLRSTGCNLLRTRQGGLPVTHKESAHLMPDVHAWISHCLGSTWTNPCYSNETCRLVLYLVQFQR